MFVRWWIDWKGTLSSSVEAVAWRRSWDVRQRHLWKHGSIPRDSRKTYVKHSIEHKPHHSISSKASNVKSLNNKQPSCAISTAFPQLPAPHSTAQQKAPSLFWRYQKEFPEKIMHQGDAGPISLQAPTDWFRRYLSMSNVFFWRLLGRWEKELKREDCTIGS